MNLTAPFLTFGMLGAQVGCTTESNKNSVMLFPRNNTESWWWESWTDASAGRKHNRARFILRSAARELYVELTQTIHNRL